MIVKPEWILSFNNREEVLKLPVNPSNYSIFYGQNNETKTNFELGDIKLIGNKKLQRINIASFFPAQPYPFCTYKDFPSPEECVATIRRWKDTRRPIRLVVTGTDINTAFAIESFEPEVTDGTGDINFSLDLEEYVFANTDDSRNGANPDDATGLDGRWVDDRTRMGIMYDVEEDSNVWDIFTEVHGAGFEYDDLARFVALNIDHIDESWNVKAGVSLSIPNVIQR